MAEFVDSAGKWRVLFQLLGGDRQGIPLAELEALISPVGGRLAGALIAQLKALSPVHTGAAGVTEECFLLAVSGAVQSCVSSGQAELESGPSTSVTAEEMRTALVQWGVLADGDMAQEEDKVGGGRAGYLLMHVVSGHMTIT